MTKIDVNKINHFTVLQTKRNVLEQRLTTLQEDYQAATDQLGYESGRVEQNKLKRQIDAIEHEIDQIQAKLDRYSDQSNPDYGLVDAAPGDPENLKTYYQERIAEWSKPRYALDRRFVQLSLLLDQGEQAQGPRWAAQERKFQDLQEILDENSDQALVLLGAPGSGKSTLLRHLELDNAQAVLASDPIEQLGDTPLTFFVPLNDYKPAHRDDQLPLPLDWLARLWAEQYPTLPALEQLLKQKRITLLLDALNEIPHAQDEAVGFWKGFLGEIKREYPGNRVLFSCRGLDYSATLSTKELPVPQVRIEPLSNPQVKAFVENYCEDYAGALWRNLEGSPQLELLRSPYYLRLLVEQTREGEIPAGRAALFSGFVRQALRREVEADNPLFPPGALLTERDRQRLIQARHWRTPYELPSRGILFEKLSLLAYEMQIQGSPRDAAQVRIDYDDALEILAHEESMRILNAGEALGVVEEDLGRDEVLYVHQLLQEYFAARRLAESPDPELVRSEWRAAKVSPRLEETRAQLADSDPLPLLPGTGWEETAILAAAMAKHPDAFVAELTKVNLPLAGRCAAQPDVPIEQGLKTELQQALITRTQDPAADLRSRIAAGLALGTLGDPRFKRCQGPDEYLRPPLIEIPGGTYAIGSEEGHYDDERPVHEVELKPFQIGKFPVTNAEWALFMRSGGYQDERWWASEEDRAWQQGESTAAGPKQERREFRQTLQASFDQIRAGHQAGRITANQADAMEQMAQISDDAFEQLLELWYPSGRQTQPDSWDDEAFNNRAQPVVGVCWHEARAYCVWLSAQTGQAFRLPTESEWEATARGFGSRRYAYGEEFDPARCNTFETHIRRTTPVGVFPGGINPEGVIDMTGNTWDWTSSLYQPYPYDPGDGREEPLSGNGRRVLRGGSWGGDRGVARAACRDGDHPEPRYDYVGFRLLCESPIF